MRAVVGGIRLACTSLSRGMFAAGLLAAPLLVSAAAAAPLPDGYWDQDERRAVLDLTRTVRLSPDLSGLGPGERAAVGHLLDAGAILHTLYERQLHHESQMALARVSALPGDGASGEARAELLALYRLFRGPIAVTPDNRREPFLPVTPIEPGKGVYPPGATRSELDAFLVAHPVQRSALLDGRSVLRRASPEQLADDLATLDAHPALALLHPGLRKQLADLALAPAGFYALPYSLAYAEPLLRVYGLLHAAADAVQAEDAEFAGYLRHRARDLLSDDYEAGDASWVTGEFRNLNAQIGSYETYDDELFGTRTFFSLSLLKRRNAESDALRHALGSLQAIEDALPYDSDRRVREQIPVGVYDVIADFGQARGGNTATILPNDALHARRYGRVILLRDNIMRHPSSAGQAKAVWQAVMLPEHADDLHPEGAVQRTLWHEVGHYLGVDRTHDGIELDLALQDSANLLEELKADLVSLHAARQLHASGYYDDAALRGVYASGVLRALPNNPPRRDQPYQTMQLMQWNWFMAKGLLRFDPKASQLAVDYRRFHDATRSLLAEVLALQAAGNRERAERFIAEWAGWDDALHGAVAKRIRDVQRYRYTLYRYEALGE